VAQTLAGQQGNRLPAGERTVGQRLADGGLLVKTDADHSSVRISFEGRQVRVWQLALASVFEPATTTERAP
jgi:hypothetical protein